MAKRYNPNLAKIHYCYTVPEIAELFSVHPHTVRNWIKKGLPLIDQGRPILIQGGDLRVFLTELNLCQKRPCAFDEVYCLKCRKPQKPAEDMADYVSDGSTKGCLTAICPKCETVINRFMNLETLQLVAQKLDVNIRPNENT